VRSTRIVKKTFAEHNVYNVPYKRTDHIHVKVVHLNIAVFFSRHQKCRSRQLEDLNAMKSVNTPCYVEEIYFASPLYHV
jgi:hypothetical protein